MSVRELATQTKLAASTIYDLQRGDSKSTTKLPKIAAATGFSAAWLEDESGPERASVAEPRAGYDANTRPAHPPFRACPVVSWANAGQWEEVIDSYEPGDAEHWYPVPPHIKCSARSFWTEVQGRSMESNVGGKSFPPGTLILVDPEVRDAITGKLVIARLDSTHEVTFKRLNNEGDRYYLEPLNTQYSVIEIDSAMQIIGTVVAATMQM